MALYRPLPFVHHLLQKHLHPQAKVIDATLGNGNDTLFIANLLNQKGELFGFDIQQEAIQNTKNKLISQHIQCKLHYFQESHANMFEILPNYVNKIDCVLFNLGYLPHYDETITTTINSTYRAILQALILLKEKGLIIIVAYPGHPNGKKEHLALQTLFAHANPNDYYITNYCQTNALNAAPSVFIIEKK